MKRHFILPILFFICLQGFIVSQVQAVSPIIKKVLILNYDPIIEASGSVRLHEYMKWNNPVVLEQQYIDAVKEVSHGRVEYQIVERQNLDEYPTKLSGYQFTDDTYINCQNNPSTCNKEFANYNTILTKYRVCEKLNAGAIDELWLWGGPWFGYHEAVMTGPNAFHASGAPITGTTCQRLLNIMGFSYRMFLDQALHSFGHRFEGNMSYLFNYFQFRTNPIYVPDNPWGRFVAYDKMASNQSGCGSVHFPPNGTTDYDYYNTAKVRSRCNDWNEYYPLMQGDWDIGLNCSSWDCTYLGNIKWWLSHLPYSDGSTDGIRNNWWSYVVDYENAIKQTETGSQYFTIKNGSLDKNISCGIVISDVNIYFGQNQACNPVKPYTSIFSFTGIIPKGSTITKAYMAFIEDGPYNNPLNLSISLKSGAVITPKINWNITDDWTYSTRSSTPDFTSLLQQIVASPSWKSGNTITLTVNYISGTGYRRIFAYEKDVVAAPKLVVEYVLAGTPTPTAIPTSVTIPGDYDGNGIVNLVDFGFWKIKYLANPPTATLVDFGIWKQQYLNQ